MDVGGSHQTPATVPGAAEESMPVDYPDKPGMWLCDHVRRVKAYAILTGKGIETNALPKEVRARLIRAAGMEAFNSKSEKQNWRIATCQAGRTEVDEVADLRCYQDLMDALMGMTERFHQQKETSYMPRLLVSALPEARRIGFFHGKIELEATYPDSTRPEIFLCDPQPSLKFGSVSVELPDLPATANGKFIIVLFDRPIKNTLDQSRERKQEATGSKTSSKKIQHKATHQIDSVHLQPISRGRGSGVDPVQLTPQEWALFRKNGLNWDMEFKSVRQPVELITNPLLRESGPVVINRQSALVSHDNDGELYLNKTMLTHLYGKKVTESTKNLTDDEKACILPWHYLTTFESFEPLAELGDRYHFFLERPNSGHTVGVYVNASAADNDVHIYLHETEGTAQQTSRLIRHTLISKMQQLYPGRKIKLFYPEIMLQRDFVSCGVFAFKAMSFFRKHPDEMDQWLESMKSNAVSEGNVGEVTIPLQQLKPGLLKVYHYALESQRPETPRLSEAQRKTIINKRQETLEQYLDKFERQVPRLGREGKTTINTGSFYQRYKMIEAYQSDIERRQEQQAEAPEVAETREKQKRAKEQELYPCPEHIVNSNERPEINQWLQSQGGEPITQKEWLNLLRYKRQQADYSDRSEFKSQHPHAYQWMEEATKEDPATPRGALMHHWLVYTPPAKKQAKKRGID